tara:strand:- start:661 stop:1926 length:1266 start_codon:yes stop_codon:yes gene_type:complete
MSFYSSSDVSTKYIDPKSFVDGARAVFDLKGHHLAILPNMRLFDNGIFGQANGQYNDLIGADSIITDIVLYDGRTELSRASNYALFRGFVCQNQDNVKSMSLRSPKTLNRLGYEVSNVDGLATFMGASRTTEALRSASDGSFIDLREVLPMLNSLSHIPSDVFQNLRLEVSYNIAQARQILSDITQTITGMLVPQLAIDMLDDAVIVSKMNKTLKNISWLEIEHDQVLFPESADFANNGTADQNVEQTVNFKLDGFKNKSVERIIQVKEVPTPISYLTGNAVNGFGRYGSSAVYKEKVQCRVNGSNIFPQQGMIGDMERLGYVADNFGECFSYPGANQLDLDSGVVVGTDITDGRKRIGQLSYNGWYLGKKVLDLQIVHSRTGLINTAIYRPEISSLNVHYFGEVKKALVLGKNGYNVVYL